MKTRATKQKQDLGMMIFAAAFVIIGLYLRDISGININKFIFLAVVAVPIFALSANRFVVFSSFLIPLYVGLPGNYVSLCILLRLLKELLDGRIRYSLIPLLLTLVATGYLMLQNILTGYTEIYNIMGAADFVTLMLLVYVTLQRRETDNVILAFLVGVTAMGLIMLINTLQYYDLQELMSSSSRLGDTKELGQNSAYGMVITIDPNFYGMNVMAAVSASVNILQLKPTSRNKKIMVVSMSVTAIICAMIGLSRAFVLALIAWGVVLIFLQGKVKNFLTLLVCVSIFAVVFTMAFPNVVEGFLNRFAGEDMEGFNGRSGLMEKHYNNWIANLGTMLFGIGLYGCNVHCMQLRYLFGMGALGGAVVFAWFWRLIKMSSINGAPAGLKRWVPFVITFVLCAAIPSAGCMDATFPLVVSIMALSLNGRNETEYK